MTTQEQPERRPRKIDLNLLPPEYLPQKASRLTIGLVIAVILLACLTGLFLAIKIDPASKNEGLTSQRDLKELELQQKMSQSSQCDQIQTDIDACNAQLAVMEEEYEIFLNKTYTWSVIMDDVQQTPKGAGGELGDISQSGDTITIGGQFSKEKYVYEYAIMLNETGHFNAVNIQTIQKIEGETEEVYQFGIEAKLKGGSEE